jgi:uncharacterized membrane protein
MIAFALLAIACFVTAGCVSGFVAVLRTSQLSRELHAFRSFPVPVPHAALVAPVPVPDLVPVPVPVPTPIPSRSLEERIGTRWITWVGSLALFLAVAFFLQVAVTRGWLGPTARIALAIAFGTTLAIVGDHFLRKRMRPLGQGLLGTGAAILYIALYAGMAAYHLYTPHAAFAGFALITLATMTLAVRHESFPIALLALLGGLATPVLVSTGAPELHALCLYLAILDLGVLAISFLRRWKLDLVAVAGTWLLLAGYLAEHQHAAAPVLAWIALFCAIFAITPFAYHLRRRIPLDPGRFVAALGNGLLAFALSSHALHHQPHAVGHVAVLLAAGYLALGVLARVRLPADARTCGGFLLLAAFFVTVALPLYLDGLTLLAAWSIEAPALLLLGHHYRSPAIRHGALVVLAVALADLLAAGLFFRAHADTPFLNLAFATAMLVPLAAAACASILRSARLAVGAAALATLLIHTELWYAEHSFLISIAVWTASGLACFLAGRRTPLWRAAAITALAVASGFVWAAYAQHADGTVFVNARFAMALAVIGAAVVIGRTHALTAATLVTAWLALSAEVFVHFEHAQLALSVTWSAVAIALCAMGFRHRVRALRVAGLALFALTAVKLLVIDLANLEQLYRVGSFLALGLLMIAASWLYARAARSARTP